MGKINFIALKKYPFNVSALDLQFLGLIVQAKSKGFAVQDVMSNCKENGVRLTGIRRRISIIWQVQQHMIENHVHVTKIKNQLGVFCAKFVKMLLSRQLISGDTSEIGMTANSGSVRFVN